jgi:hypothetical protein
MNATTEGTMSRAEMLSELSLIQNEIEYQDILTITSYMNDEEVAAHLDRYRAKVAR